MKKLYTLALLFINSLVLSAQNIINFQQDVYFINPKSSELTICYELELKGFSSQTPKIKAKVVGDSLFNTAFKLSPKQSSVVPSKSGKYCLDYVLKGSILSSGDYFSGQISFEMAESQGILLGNNPYVTVVSSSPPQVPIPHDNEVDILIKGYDNHVSEYFTLSLLNTKPLQRGYFIGITNSNFSNGSWLPKNTNFEYLEFKYLGKGPLPAYSTICITKDYNKLGELIYTFLIDGKRSPYFAITSDETTEKFLTEVDWTNVYVYGEPFLNNSTLTNTFTRLKDGITFGISKNNYAFDIPFEWEFMQMFFTQNILSQYAFLNCDISNLNCNVIEYIKDFSHWISGSGNSSDNLSFFQVCSNNCDIVRCRDSLFVQKCIGDSIDVIYLMDESGSVQPNELNDMLIAITESSENLKCMVSNSRFAFTVFSGTDQFKVIRNFSDSQLNVLDYERSCATYCSTDVPDAFSKLNQNILIGNLILRKNAKTLVIFLTDVPDTDKNYAIYSFNAVNQTKSPPINAKIPVVYYTNKSSVNFPYIAACASKGGSYTGTIASNPGDPEGPGVPRLFFPYQDFGSNLNRVLQDLSTCDTLSLNYSGTGNYSVDVGVSNGGKILQTINPLQYITNQTGTYSFVLNADGNCQYTVNYTYEVDDCLTESSSLQYGDSSSGSYSNDDSDERKGKGGKLEKREAEDEILIYPNPTSRKLFVDLSDDYEGAEISVYTSSGKLTRISEVGESELNRILDVSELTSGMYFISFQKEGKREVLKKFVVLR